MLIESINTTTDCTLRENKMKVLKFGGTSLKNAQRFIDCAAIIQASGDSVAIVVSAPATVTNQLEVVIRQSIDSDNWQTGLVTLETFFTDLLLDLTSKNSAINTTSIEQAFKGIFTDLRRWLSGSALLKQCPSDIYAKIISSGERFSVLIMQAILISSRPKVTLIDPLKTLVAEGEPLEAVINITASKKRFSTEIEDHCLYLMPGFIAADKHGKPMLLGRNGSDYSATALSVLLSAQQCEIWTDVDGVYNCDPSLIHDANLLNTLSYQEAMELSYFGAKVLHPKTISPISQHHIPCLIKNTSKPEAKGTLISNTSVIRKEKVKAISHLDGMTMLNISGSGMKGMVGIAGRIFSCLSRAGISIVLITQSSSEYSISLCIHSKDAELAEETLQQEFKLELANQLLETIELIDELAIVSLIGDGMLQSKGISARFLSALADASINIVAIAQGSSERSISAVITSTKADAAIKACHQQFFDSQRYIDLFLIGCGGVGSELLRQINQQKSILANKQISIRVCGIANSQSILLDAEGIDLDCWAQNLAKSSERFCLKTLKNQVIENQLINPVIVDCTSNETISASYIDFFNAGFHLVTANKKANSDSLNYYYGLRQAALNNRRKFLYDTNVGAGLPVIENLQNLILAGDQLLKFNGILSGSLSYIFGELETGKTFSEVTLNAKKKGFTEPDPRDDLSGMDVARKLLILARETGLDIELSDIQIESAIPKDFSLEGDVSSFMQRLNQVDSYYQAQLKSASDKGEVLRYVGSIEEGKCKVSIQSVNKDNPLFAIKDGENALAFYSHYYQPIPLVLRGYGAGAAVTAAGIYSDILKTVL